MWHVSRVFDVSGRGALVVLLSLAEIFSTDSWRIYSMYRTTAYVFC